MNIRQTLRSGNNFGNAMEVFPLVNRQRRDDGFWHQQTAAQKQAQSFLELILGVIDTLQFGKRKLGTPT